MLLDKLFIKLDFDNILNFLLRLMIILGLLFVWLAIYNHPLVADDWYVQWILKDSGSSYNFITYMYSSWTGRLFSMTLNSIVLSSPNSILIFKIFILPVFILFGSFVHYISTGHKPYIGKPEERGFLFTTAIIWLGIPVPSETVVQVTGAIAYLFPATLGFGFLVMFRFVRDKSMYGKVTSNGTFYCFIWLFMGFITGTSN